MRARIIIAAVAAVCVVAGAGGYFLFFAKSPAERALDKSVAHMRIVAHFALDRQIFGEDLNDVKAKYEIARPELNPAKSGEVTRFIDKTDAAYAIWLESGELHCPANCKDKLAPLMIRLGIIRGEENYAAFVAGMSMNDLISIALKKADASAME